MIKFLLKLSYQKIIKNEQHTFLKLYSTHPSLDFIYFKPTQAYSFSIFESTQFQFRVGKCLPTPNESVALVISLFPPPFLGPFFRASWVVLLLNPTETICVSRDEKNSLLQTFTNQSDLSKDTLDLRVVFRPSFVILLIVPKDKDGVYVQHIVHKRYNLLTEATRNDHADPRKPMHSS